MKKIEKQHEDLLLDNASTLLCNWRRIISDPRMRYATINYTCGEAKNGVDNLSNPTVGAYIDWWTKGNNTIQINCFYGPSLCCKLTVKDSWLDGSQEFSSSSRSKYSQPILNARDQWRNMKAYIEDNTLPEGEIGITPYTFEEVIEILNNIPNIERELNATEFFYQKQYIAHLEYEVFDKHRNSLIYKGKYHNLLMSGKRAELEDMYNRHSALLKKIIKLKDDKCVMENSLKKDVKNGVISQSDANKVLDSMEEEISAHERESLKIRVDELASLFPNESIIFGEVMSFIHDTRND